MRWSHSQRRRQPPALQSILLGLVLLAGSAWASERQLPNYDRGPARHPDLSRVNYSVTIDNAHLHTAVVTMELTGYGNSPLDVAMPAWNPGAYHLVVPAKNVLDISAAVPGQKGQDQPLEIRRLDRQTWRVQSPPKNGRVRIRYRVYLPKPSVIRSYVGADYASLTGFDVFLYVVGNLGTEIQLDLTSFRDWTVATALQKTGDHRYAAPNYDVFIDAPILWGRLTTRTFDVDGVPHHLVWSGDTDFDIDRMAAKTEAIVRATRRMFGGPLPYPDYWFLWRFREHGGGGLEHLNSTRIDDGPTGFRDPDEVDRYLSVTAHEYVHTWNVKRIRPKSLGPFDYSKEVYTPHLWFCEGVTSYLGDLALLRAGLWTRERYLRSLAAAIQTLESTAARHWMSLAEASMTTWHKAENGSLGRIDYYNKGQLVGLMLDLELRTRTDGRVTLETLMQRLYRDFLADGLGFDDGDIERTATELSGADMAPFFRRYVSGTEPLPIDDVFDPLGIVHEDKPGRDFAYLGVRNSSSGPALVRRVESDSPAAKAGVRAGDTIIAIGAQRVDGKGLGGAIRDLAPGSKVEITLFRGESVMRVEATLGRRRRVVDPNGRPSFRHVRKRLRLRKSAPAGARRLRADWLRTKAPAR